MSAATYGTIVLHDAPRGGRAVKSRLTAAGWVHEDGDVWHCVGVAPGYTLDDPDRILRAMMLAGCTFAAWEDPCLEFLGGVLMYAPELGEFRGDCGSDGLVLLTGEFLDALVDGTPPLSLVAAVNEATGRAWRNAFAALAAVGQQTG